MIRFAPLLLLALAACASRGGTQQPPPASSPAMLSTTEVSEPTPARPAPGADPRPAPLAAGLPAHTAGEAPMRAQPLLKATVLRTLPAATPLRVLGHLDNADGRWLSALVGDVLGWIPAEQVEYAP